MSIDCSTRGRTVRVYERKRAADQGRKLGIDLQSAESGGGETVSGESDGDDAERSQMLKPNCGGEG